MRSFYTWCLFLWFCGLTGGRPCAAQQASPAAGAISPPAPNPVDTLEALHKLFQAKRKASPAFLVAAPVVLGLTFALVRAAVVSQVVGGALGQRSSGSSSTIVPILGVVAGSAGFGALVERYTRYTKSREKRIVRKYERIHALPAWVNQQLLQHGKL